MNTSVYLSFCDPEFAYSESDLRARLALHALLLEKPTIQDNFLLSEHLWRLTRKDDFVVQLIRFGILQIAIRNNASQSLVNVNTSLVDRTRAGLYRPFLGDSLHLYESHDFRDYIQTLDRAVSSGATLVEWNPMSHGAKYRAKMMESALTSASEWDLRVEDAMDVVDAVEKLVPGGTHSRSAYWDVADRYYGGDDRNEKVKRWARAFYLTNIPDETGLSASMPTEALTTTTSSRAHELAWLAAEASSVDSDGQYFFNPVFLANVSAEAIRDLRQTASFSAMQGALRAGDADLARGYFKDYVHVVSAAAPKVIPAFSEKISTFESHIKAKTLISMAAPALWTISLGVASTGAGIPLAIGTAGLGFLAKALGTTRGSEKMLQRQMEEARAVLKTSRFRGSILTLIDVVDGDSHSVRDSHAHL